MKSISRRSVLVGLSSLAVVPVAIAGSAPTPMATPQPPAEPEKWKRYYFSFEGQGETSQLKRVSIDGVEQPFDEAFVGLDELHYAFGWTHPRTDTQVFFWVDPKGNRVNTHVSRWDSDRCVSRFTV